MENFVELSSSSTDVDDLEYGPSGERWPPLGAAATEEEQCSLEDYFSRKLDDAELDRVHEMEDQQELLNSSLIALTSHFAQIQFRIRQTVDAAPEKKELLLRELADFAFRGIPEMTDPTVFIQVGEGAILTEGATIEREKRREKQKELIDRLKTQLEELESYAYEMGEAGLPQSVVVKKQKVIIDELKEKLNLNVEDMDRLTLEDIRGQVDEAIGQLVNPLKMKEQLVMQLKTQIMDLERFIEFLQGDSWEEAVEMVSELKRERNINCSCSSHVPDQTFPGAVSYQPSFKPKQNLKYEDKNEMREKALHMVRRAAALLQLFTVSQFGCGNGIHLNSLKKSSKVNHWGDLRARLELAVVNILALASEPLVNAGSSEYSSDNEALPSCCDAKMATAVRKQLSITIRDLMQHGLACINSNTSLVPLMGCFPIRSRDEVGTIHAWALILRYYDLKNGPMFNATPVRKLSQSFNLNIVGSKAISHKQSMLSTIGNIIQAHTPFKRSYDTQFKAFVCSALNSKTLVVWLRLIFRCKPLIEMFYEPWSYVVKTGFEDSLQSLDKLSSIDFELPVDIAIQQFQNIKDAF